MALGIAIIGSGIFAREEHLPAVLSTPRLALRAIWSRSLASAKALAQETHDVDLYSKDAGEGRSYDDLLRRTDIHALIIVLPIDVQPQFIKAALIAGKHVLSEKPIAADVAEAQSLQKWYCENIDLKKYTWGVAENYRYQDSLRYARDEISKMGRILGIRVAQYAMVRTGEKYYETAWRKTPSYQGGFLLDAGVHFIAAARLLLGDKDRIIRVSAETVQLQSHLPPVDTLDATIRTESGVTGSFSFSFGTTFKTSEYSVACDKGTVTIRGNKVVVTDGSSGERVKDFPDEGMGVKQEIQAWADGLAAGLQNERQRPEEALKDLEIVEKMLRSGEAKGTPQDIVL
ncbi:MAG: hypothetical protein M1826_001729 [Phylliscum demangeonii]|nr:MAG: hypothetical protein M1826_001729 [Phylliscum demangeonii]